MCFCFCDFSNIFSRFQFLDQEKKNQWSKLRIASKIRLPSNGGRRLSQALRASEHSERAWREHWESPSHGRKTTKEANGFHCFQCLPNFSSLLLNTVCFCSEFSNLCLEDLSRSPNTRAQSEGSGLLRHTDWNSATCTSGHSRTTTATYTHTHKTTHHLDKFGMPQSGMIEVSVHIAGNLLFQGILPFLWLKLWNECFIFNVRIRVSLDASCQQLPSGFVFAHMAVAVPQVGWEEILFRTQRIGRKTLREHSYLKGSACCLSYERRRKSDFYIQRRLFIQQMWLLAVSQRMGMIPFDVNHIPHSRPWVCDRNSNGSAECDSCSSAT